MKYFKRLDVIDTTEIVKIAEVLSHQFEYKGAKSDWQEVKQTESFQDLVKYGEWMPVKGEEK